jgi:hypothetical protein
VKRETGGSQQPWVSSSPIDGSFYFVAPVTTAPQATIEPAQRLANAPPGNLEKEPLRSPRNGEEGGNNFDGKWAYTGTGTNCRGSASGFLVISGGLVSSKNGRGIGRVSPDGTYHAASVSDDGVALTATGRMSGNAGGGSYRRADGCVGRWIARRL